MATYSANNTTQYRTDLVVTQKSQSIPNNTSVVSVTLKVVKLSGTGRWAGTPASTWSLSIDGQTRSGTFTYDFRNYTTLELFTGDFTISHDSSGSKSVNTSATVSLRNTGAASPSGTLSLTTIPRASSFTLSGSTTTGDASSDPAISVAITRAVSTFTHIVRWRVGSGTWNTVTSNAGGSTTFKVPHSALPNSTSGTITVGVQTRSGTTNIGSEQTRTRTLTVPASIKPKLTGISHSDTVTLVKNAIGAYVQNNTKLSLAITGDSAGTGASITAYKINVAGQTINARTGTTNVITTSGSMNITGTVTDSRGRVSEPFSVGINVLPYSPPVITGYSAFRSNSGGSADFFNTSATVRFKTSVSSLNSKNTATYRIRSKLLPSGTWSTKTNTTSVGLSTNVTKTYSGYQRTSYYQFEIVISDKLSVVTISNDALMVPTAGVPFLVGHGGTASSFGKIATHGSTYDLEIGEKGLRVDGPVIDKNGGEVLATHTHSASQISSGTLAAARIPNLAASKITSGTIADARLPASVKIESGSNSYGHWTKFPDGTLINRGTISMPHADSDYRTGTVRFPLAFVNTTYNPSAVPNAGGVANFGATVTGNYTTTTMTITVTRRSAAGLTMTWIAIGRWK